MHLTPTLYNKIPFAFDLFLQKKSLAPDFDFVNIAKSYVSKDHSRKQSSQI